MLPQLLDLGLGWEDASAVAHNLACVHYATGNRGSAAGLLDRWSLGKLATFAGQIQQQQTGMLASTPQHSGEESGTDEWFEERVKQC